MSLLGDPTTVAFHHSDSPRDTTTFENVESWHVTPKPAGNGWPYIGYHYFVDAEGSVYKGRALHVRGAHAPPNRGRIGICIAGDNLQKDQRWTPVQIMRGYQLWRHLEFIFPGLSYAGHRDLMEPGYTECPGVEIHELFELTRMSREYDWGM